MNTKIYYLNWYRLKYSFLSGVYKVASPPLGGNSIKLFGKKIKRGRREGEGKGKGIGKNGRESEEGKGKEKERRKGRREWKEK